MMTIDKMRVTCRECEHVFDAEYVTNCVVSIAVASMEAIRCEKCGAECGMGGNYKDAPPVTARIEDRVSWWKNRGEHGISSATIFYAMGGGWVYGSRDDIPYDPADYERCRRLLDLIPEWRADMGKIVKRFPYWKPLVDRWDEFDALHDEEFPSGVAPKLYALMQVARDESRKIGKGEAS